ncbi:MAG: 2-oxo acid dehydrogenase subunit E2 [Phycisphaerales bacterium]|nr:2-oxo acid dehydrogenase subunit E2 [Phycisphaerales bacterium]
MPIEITMPRLSDTMEQGTVVKWYVKEGDAVSSGDVIADIETDKATMELQSFDEGTVARLAVGEGKAVAVGTVIAVLAEEGEDASAAGEGAGATPSARAAPGKAAFADAGSEPPGRAGSSAATATSAPESSRAERNGSRVFASPLARKIAEERGLDLASIEGTGPSGRITRKDVEAAVPSSAPRRAVAEAQTERMVAARVPAAPLPELAAARLEDRTVTLSNMRATIARRLVESKTTIPHYQVTVSARMDALLSLREQLNEQLEPQGVKLSVNDFLVRACALAMHQHPFVNASWVEGKGGDSPAIRLHGRVNVGVAIALPAEKGGGLVVGVIRDADRVGLRQISDETRRLAAKAREKGLSVEEMSDSTFTISNLGMFGVDHFTAIINPPNAAILAVGRAVERPTLEQDDDGETRIAVVREMAMTMSSDHRIIDGAMAAQYLGTVKQMLERPASLLV